MKRKHDTQRGKVYQAEDAVIFPSHSNFHAPVLRGFQDYVMKATTGNWFRHYFWRLARCGVTVRLNRGRHSGAGQRGARMSVGTHTRLSRALAIHEISHWAVGQLVTSHGKSWAMTTADPADYPRRFSDIASHGPEFCGIYLVLVRQFLGPVPAADLAERFKAYGVAFNVYEWNEPIRNWEKVGEHIPEAVKRKNLRGEPCEWSGVVVERSYRGYVPGDNLESVPFAQCPYCAKVIRLDSHHRTNVWAPWEKDPRYKTREPHYAITVARHYPPKRAGNLTPEWVWDTGGKPETVGDWRLVEFDQLLTPADLAGLKMMAEELT